MTTVVELPDSADTLRYRVQVGKSLQQEEVRISVNAKALIQTRDNNQAALLKRIPMPRRRNALVAPMRRPRA